MQTDRRDVKPKTSFHKIEHPLGSKIFQPKVYSWEPSWYFGGAGMVREVRFRGAGGGLGGVAQPPPMQQE